MLACIELIGDRELFHEHPDYVRELKEDRFRRMRRKLGEKLLADLEASPNPVTCLVEKVERRNHGLFATELVYRVETTAVRTMDVTYRRPMDHAELMRPQQAPPKPRPTFWQAVKTHFCKMVAEVQYDGPRG